MIFTKNLCQEILGCESFRLKGIDPLYSGSMDRCLERRHSAENLFQNGHPSVSSVYGFVSGGGGGFWCPSQKFYFLFFFCFVF